MRPRTVHGFGLLVVVVTLCAAWADQRPVRIWILPFEQLDADPALEYLKEAIPALVAVAVSESDLHAVVDREHLNALLAEQSLTLEGLIAPDTRHRIGRLLGATVMITGSFVRQEGNIRITMRAADLETGIVTSTGEARGPISGSFTLVGQVYRQLAAGFDKRLPGLAPNQIDDAPLANLHFMKGLGHYFSARYSQALGEFMVAADDNGVVDVARLWLARTYLAQRRHDHAYLELNRLMRGRPADAAGRDVASMMRECEKHLSREDVKTIRNLAALGRGRSE